MSTHRPHPSRRAVRAAWIMARAFTPHRVIALLALPWALLAVLPATIRGGLFLDATRTGMVLLAPINLFLDLFVLILVAGTFTAVIASGAVLIAAALNAVPALLVVTAVLMIAGMTGALSLLPRRGGSALPFGPETPTGPRWEMAGLAQLPGTRLTAVQLARQVLTTVPPAGTVIVATANTPAQFQQYQRFGFTGSDKRRVHLVVA